MNLRVQVVRNRAALFVFDGDFAVVPLGRRRGNSVGTLDGQTFGGDRHRNKLPGQIIKGKLAARRVGQAKSFDQRRFLEDFGDEQRSGPGIGFRRRDLQVDADRLGPGRKGDGSPSRRKLSVARASSESRNESIGALHFPEIHPDHRGGKRRERQHRHVVEPGQPEKSVRVFSPVDRLKVHFASEPLESGIRSALVFGKCALNCNPAFKQNLSASDFIGRLTHRGKILQLIRTRELLEPRIDELVSLGDALISHCS